MDIEVFIGSGESHIFDEASMWCKENDIIILSYNVLHSENVFDRAIIYGFIFSFENMEDATAFKLRWG